MKNVLMTLLLSAIAMCAFSQQKKVDVRLDFPGKFDDMTEQELMHLHGEMWADEWVNVIKPLLLDEMIYELNKSGNKSFDFGRYPDARIILQFSMQNMDENDGETTFLIICYALGEDGSKHNIYYDTTEVDGKSTKYFTCIAPKAFKRAASRIGFMFTTNVLRAVKKNPKLKEL